MRRWGIPFVILSLAGNVGAADKCLHFFNPRVPQDSKDPVLHHLKAARLDDGAGIHPYRGSAVVRLRATKPFGGYPAYIEIYPGPPHLTFRVNADWPKDKKAAICSYHFMQRRPLPPVIRGARGLSIHGSVVRVALSASSFLVSILLSCIW